MSDVNIISIDKTTRRISFSLFEVPNRAIGIEALMQLCIKTVMTTPGLDVFASEYGAGLLSYIGAGLTANDIPRISVDMSYIVSTAAKQILFEQSTQDIVPSERLRDMSLADIRWLPDEGMLDVRIRIVSEAGELTDVSLANQLRLN